MAHSNDNTQERTFSHLTPYDRGCIGVLRGEGKTLQEIADVIGCHRSTISRELKRGTVTQRKSNLTEYQAYFPETGQAVYEKNRSRCGAKYKLTQTAAFIHFAVEKMQQDHWSPDAVCGYAKANQLFEDAMVCTKTLYHYIDLGLLPVKNIDLPLKVTRQTKRKRTRQHKKILGASIDERPAHIEDRQEFGHWEIDTVLGNRKRGVALLTLTERKTRKEHILKIRQKTVESVHHAIQSLKTLYGKSFSSVFKTMTSDNGSEFSELTQAMDSDGVAVYYTHPYTASERGTNERHNGLIRRFIPIMNIGTIRLVDAMVGKLMLPSKFLGKAYVRGFTSTISWSPYFAAVLLVLSYVDISVSDYLMYGISLGFIQVVIGNMLFLKETRDMDLPTCVANQGKITLKLLELIVLFLFLTACVFLLERVLQKSMISIVSMSAFIFPFLWSVYVRVWNSFLKALNTYRKRFFHALMRLSFFNSGIFRCGTCFYIHWRSHKWRNATFRKELSFF